MHAAAPRCTAERTRRDCMVRPTIRQEKYSPTPGQSGVYGKNRLQILPPDENEWLPPNRIPSRSTEAILSPRPKRHLEQWSPRGLVNNTQTAPLPATSRSSALHRPQWCTPWLERDTQVVSCTEDSARDRSPLTKHTQTGRAAFVTVAAQVNPV